jgi:adenine-specific DNA-methyltransferase
MALIDELLKQVPNGALRAALAKEVETLRARRSFGLVFERHIPEIAVVPGGAIRVGSVVRRRDRPDDDADLVVEAVTSRTARVRPVNSEGGAESVLTRMLASVKPFGEPVFPGLRSLGRLSNASDRPYHAVINGENFHVLQLLAAFGEGSVDCIYIDPPYNTGARDWKYNNRYVDESDSYRHSKWLSMMEKRLKIARRLLSTDGVLIVTIDEKEYLRLGLLLDQIFSDCRIQMVSTLINPALQSRPGAFGRSDEYIFFVMRGQAAPKRTLLSRAWVSERGRTFIGTARWDLLRRSGTSPARSDSPGGFYPIYIDPEGPKFREIGEPLPEGVSEARAIEGAVAVLPIRKNGSEGRWQVSPATLREYLSQGRVRIGGSEEDGFVIYYLKGGEYDKVLNGEYPVLGRNVDGSLNIGEVDDGDDQEVVAVPSTQWRIPSHDATQYGSRLLEKFVPGANFPFPKSLYAVRDALRFFLEDKPDALILDFFAGSGTTLHAAVLLNGEDGGRRRTVLVTNNEVGDKTARRLNTAGYFDGDREYESYGIFESVTKPRVEAAISGRLAGGAPIHGTYLNGRPMADGFDENVEFFDLVYLDYDDVELGRCFGAIDPAIWLSRTARGARRGHDLNKGFFFDDDAGYAVLADDAKILAFEAELARRSETLPVFHVTNSPEAFADLVSLLGADRFSRMLYRDFVAACRANVAASA